MTPARWNVWGGNRYRTLLKHNVVYPEGFVGSKREIIGFVGLGNMGRPMVSHLIRDGFPVHVFDISAKAMEHLTKMGASACNSPADLASKIDIVITSLPDSPVIEEVFLGNKGIIEGIKCGAVAIDMSSASPSSTRKISGFVEAKGARMLDAPVSGGPIGAESGKLTIMIGGDEKTFESIRHVLSLMGNKLLYMGPIGSGHAMKAVNNYLQSACLVASMEAMVLAAKAGLSPSRVLEVINGGSGRNFSTETRFPRILKREFDPGNLSISLLHKDVNIATTMGRELKMPMPIGNLTQEILCYGIAKGGGDRVSHFLVTYLEELMNVELKE
jgi:3-hydroxyisobutyrate dehydrogenase-like beta-hydroxyacid dehydrogenase